MTPATDDGRPSSGQRGEDVDLIGPSLASHVIFYHNKSFSVERLSLHNKWKEIEPASMFVLPP